MSDFHGRKLLLVLFLVPARHLPALTFKQLGWYLNSSAWFMKHILFSLLWADPSSREVLLSVWSVSLSVIRCNNSPVHLHWVGRKGQTKKETETGRLLLEQL
jgi:hypothetical protein